MHAHYDAYVYIYGRYECTGLGKKGLPADQRTCLCCGRETEDEVHFLLRCPRYSIARGTLLEVYNRNMPHSYLLSTACSEQMLFNTIVESANPEVVNALADFVFYAFKRRESILAAAPAQQNGAR